MDENRIVRLLKDRYPRGSRSIKKGIGDDAAVILPKGAEEYWIATTDMLLEKIDFCRDWTAPYGLGIKSLAVNLSDLAAMGARPRFFTVSLALTPDIPEKWILEFYRGLTKLGRSKGAWLIGGDLSGSKSEIMISIAALGESLRRKVLCRSGGKPGDFLFVTGKLGRSAAGLKLLQAGRRRPESKPQREAIQAQLRPAPRCEAGLWLAQSGFVHCMMDLSDGLSADLPRMCSAGGVGAEIDCSRLPLFTESSLWGCDPEDLALNGGEDFELLFAVPESKVRMFEKTYPSKFPRVSNIGAMSSHRGVWVHDAGKNRRRMPERGFDHFRAKR